MLPKQILIVLFSSLALNFSGTLLQDFYSTPLFLDTTGTILAAVLIGPWAGGLVGLSTNLLQGIFHTPLSIPFGAVSFSVGLLAGYLTIALKGYHRWFTPLVVGVATGVVASLIAAPIATYLFGGISAHGIDKIVSAFVEGGGSILSSAFWGRLPFSIIDKLISAYLVFFLVIWLPVYKSKQYDDAQ